MDLDQTELMAALQAAGWDEDKIESLLDKVAPVEEEVVPEFKPKVFVRQDQIITLGDGEETIQFPIRLIGLQDLLSMSSNVEYWYNYIGGVMDDIGKKLKVGEVNPLFLAHYLTGIALKDKKSGHYTKFAVSIFETLADLFSSPGHDVDAEFIAGCIEQLPEALTKYIEVNKQRFLALLGQLPDSMNWQISSLITMIFAIVNTVNQVAVQQKKPTKSTGGTKSGGSTSSSTRSRKKPAASKKRKSAA